MGRNERGCLTAAAIRGRRKRKVGRERGRERGGEGKKERIMTDGVLSQEKHNFTSEHVSGS